jgi:hypothetical protein
MDKIFEEQIPIAQRSQLLKDNADGVEVISYMKQYSPEQILEMKERLANVSIDIADIEDSKKDIMKEFKAQLEPLNEEKSLILKGIKEKAEFVKEECYKITSQEERMTGFYNSEGILVSARPATSDELSGTIFMTLREGTNN